MNSEHQNNEGHGITEDILPGFENIDIFSQDALRNLLVATKLSNDIPSSGNNWDYYSSFSGFNSIMKVEGEKILTLLTSILRHQGIKGRIEKRPDLQEKFDLLTDFNDAVFERVGTSLDEAAGVKKEAETLILQCSASGKQVLSGTWNKKIHERCNEKPAANNVRLLAAKHIQRPQLKFKEKIDNRPTVFIPKIKEKPNSLKPLAILLERVGDMEQYSHPYEWELLHWNPTYGQIQSMDPIPPLNKNATPLIMVTTETDVQNMLEELLKEKEIAVDLEHHSYRSYLGLTCLMQISTRRTDYLVDTLSLWDHLQCLNKVFTNPSIVKVFHGADQDILWLQRDLGLYIVNMFDTHQAAKALHFPRLSLALLLQYYCKVTADKQFQLADWRIRPLPEKMVEYARDDTHYLLYIYDMMRNELIERGNAQKNLLVSVLNRSRDLCLMRYEKPISTEDSHMELNKKSQRLFNARQKYALKALYRWRDRVAREEDESTGYVLPNHMLLQISELLPRDMQGILACCNPIPTLVRQQLVQLNQLILEARGQSLTKVDLELAPVKVVAQPHLKVDFSDLLHCPHDLSHDQEKGDNLPTLLDPSASVIVPHIHHKHLKNLKIRVKSSPGIEVFVSSSSSEEDSDMKNRVCQSTFISPYERFKLVQPFCKTLNEEISTKGNTDDARVTRLKEHFKELTARTPELLPQASAVMTPVEREEDKEKQQNQEQKEEEEEEEGRVEPLRYMIKKGKKRNSSEMITSTSEDAKRNKKRQQSDTGEKNEAASEFTPYDYKQIDYGKLFGRNNPKKNKKIFPEKNEKNFREMKSKCFRKGGNKSMTYTKFQEKR